MSQLKGKNTNWTTLEVKQEGMTDFKDALNQ